jgi:hypothetical protein
VQGATASEYDLFIALEDSRLKNAWSRVFNTVTVLTPGANEKDLSGTKASYRSITPLTDLMYIHGHEVLVDGCFNGDHIQVTACCALRKTEHNLV